jgi:hypothetical protein
VAVIDSSVGVDPGQTTGMAFLDYRDKVLIGRYLLQCDAHSAPFVLKGLLTACYSEFPGNFHGRRSGSVEAFVTGAGAGSRGKPAEVTRQLVMEMTELLQLAGYTVKIRPAADVKPWASDNRLVAGHVADDPKKINGEFRHAYDAGRHALYGAKEAGFTDDPLRSLRTAREGHDGQA